MLRIFSLLFVKIAFTCIPTSPGARPCAPGGVDGPGAQTTARPATTTAAPTGCCEPLNQTLTMSEFPDGNLTFSYDNTMCRRSVIANCSQTDPAFDLFAALFANGFAFLDIGSGFVTFPGTCNLTDLRWYMADPPLRIDTLECLLSNPPPAPEPTVAPG